MKEFLVNHDNKWTLQLLDSDTEENSYRVAVPSGVEVAVSHKNGNIYFWKDDGLINWVEKETDFLGRDSGWYVCSESKLTTFMEFMDEWGGDGSRVVWQRSETEYLMQGENGDKLMESVAELNGININSINDGFTGIAKAADKLSNNIRKTLGFSFNPVDGESQEVVKVTIDELKHRVGIDATLAERQATYGSFEDVAFVTENVMSVLSKARPNALSDLPDTHRMALYMIASKMARIVNGDFNSIDGWHDISGYATLIERIITGVNDVREKMD